MYEDLKDYFKWWQMHQASYDSALKSQESLRQQLAKYKLTYYYIALPTRWRFDNDSKWSEYHSQHYKSLAMFKLISFTPMTLTGGIFTSRRIATYPSMILETMDGKRFEALEPKIAKKYRNTVMSSYMVYTDDVLRELEKNFVHPEMKLNKKWIEFCHFTDTSDSDRGWQEVYTESRALSKYEAAKLYEKWEKEQSALKFYAERDITREHVANFNRQHADKAQQAKVDAFESKFSQPSHKVFKCPKCGTNNRVPVRNKRIEISCRCGHKYTVMC